MDNSQIVEAEPEVISALKKRAVDPSSNPHSRCDTCRIGFVAGSGAMAAAITGGMVAALQANGITSRCFDLFIGTSAGLWPQLTSPRIGRLKARLFPLAN
jgi:hypothetical protein